MNLILGILSMLLCFSSIVLIEKIFKKEGLYVWICLATVIANVLVCKTISLFGFTSTLGNIIFASIFLATDIMNEKYGADQSKKAILLGMFSSIIFVVSTQISLLYIPDNSDLAQESMKTLFSINLRTSIASLIMYILSNLLDIWLFEKLKEKMPEKLWLRNNLATILANCSENYFFNYFAFVGLLSFPTIISIATTSSIIEIIIAICDTPFLYLAVKTSKSKSDT